MMIELMIELMIKIGWLEFWHSFNWWHLLIGMKKVLNNRQDEWLVVSGIKLRCPNCEMLNPKNSFTLPKIHPGGGVIYESEELTL